MFDNLEGAQMWPKLAILTRCPVLAPAFLVDLRGCPFDSAPSLICGPLLGNGPDILAGASRSCRSNWLAAVTAGAARRC